MTSARTVADLGEEGLVSLLRTRFHAGAHVTGIGDDAAVFAAPGRTLVFTTDTMVEGVDFDLSYASGRDIGWKVLAINLSDVAAMGASPAQAVATLCLPPATELALVEEVIEGLAGCAAEWGVQVVGGDLSSSGSIVLGLALLGTVDGAVLRSGASAGDAICVTGALGGSAGGLSLLQNDPRARGALVQRHLRPTPRVEEGVRLRRCGATSMIDLSDGLVIDLDRLLDSSGAGCEVDTTAVPLDPALVDTDLDARRCALFGGEDFELLFTIAPARVEDARSALEEVGSTVSEIGRVTTGARRIGGVELEAMKEETWDHLRRP